MEGERDAHLEQPRYMYMLGLCRLHLEDVVGAYDCFRRAAALGSQDAAVRCGILLGIAAIPARRGETKRAVEYYLQVLDIEKDNKTAQKGLALIRRHTRDDTFSAWAEAGRWKRLIPRPLKLPPRVAAHRFFARAVKPCVIIVIVLAAGLAAWGVLRKVDIRAVTTAAVTRVKDGGIGALFKGDAGQKGGRPGLAQSKLSEGERAAPVNLKGSFLYVLTDKQVLNAFSKARGLFTDYHDEAARVELNRILCSNASDTIKAKARLLEGFLETPSFTNLKDKFDYKTVAKEPALYRGCGVVWRGMLTNVKAEANATDFDLLVGYDTKTVLLGTVHTHFDTAVPVNSEKPFEVLGTVQPGGASGDGKISLKGLAVHELR
jgi:hypothetical protein